MEQNIYPKFNQQTNEFFWKLVEKYEKQYPDFADALNECIQGNINDDNLKVIREHEFGQVLDEKECKEMKQLMSWYYVYIVDMVLDEQIKIEYDDKD